MEENTIAPEESTGGITFSNTKTDEPILEIRVNGDVLFKGKFIENDLQITEGLREFLKVNGLWKG